METDIYEIKGVPNEGVPDLIADLRADPRYISHLVIPEGGGKSTVIAVFRKQGDRLASAVKVETIKKKPPKASRKKPA
jgi:hypothetical protein